MAVTTGSFLRDYPEFRDTDVDVVAAALRDAALFNSASVLGDRYDAALGLYAAHLLSSAPFGTQARLAEKEGTTTYLERWKTLAKQVAGGPHVVGDVGPPPGWPAELPWPWGTG